MKAFADGLETVCFALSAMILVAMSVIVGWQVVARKLLNDSPSWSEPLALLLLLFAVMIGAGAGVRRGLHIGLFWFRQRMSQAVQRWVARLELLLIAMLAGALLVYGWSMVTMTWAYSLPGLPVSMGWQYVPLMLGGGFMLFFSLERLLEDLFEGVGE